jgi:DNA-binding transcriptional LysR family regulator
MTAGQGLSGPLRITIPPLMVTDAVSTDIAQFAQEHPQVQLEFVGDNNLLNLHQREADVAIRVTAAPPETLWGRKLTDQHSGYYAATEWLENNPLKKGDFSGEVPIIAFSSWQKPIPKKLVELCPNTRVVAKSDDMITAMQMVRAGLGITRMPRILGENLQGVCRIEALPWEAYVPIWLLTHPDLRKAPRVEAFMRHISACIVSRRDQYQMSA